MKKSISIAVCLIILLVNNSLTKAMSSFIEDPGEITAAIADDFLGVITSDPKYSTLEKVLDVSGLEEELKTIGPFTVFAPVNKGFAAFPEAKLDKLVKDSTALNNVLQYHIVRGRYSIADLVKAISADKNNVATLTTLSGDTLSFTLNNDKNLEITDERGGKAAVTSVNQLITPGVVHGINKVLLPE